MKQEILDWYAERQQEAHKQIENGLIFGLSKHQIEAAMEHCYNKIVVEGKPVPDNEVAWYIRHVARDIDTTGIEEEHALIEKAKDMVAEAQNEIKTLKKTYAKLERTVEAEKSASEKAKSDLAGIKVVTKKILSNHQSELQKLHNDKNMELRKTTESYVNIINNKNDELRKNKASYEAELNHFKASRETLKKKLEDRVSEEMYVTKSISETAFDLWDQLEKERKKAKRIATVYYIITISALIQAGLWLL